MSTKCLICGGNTDKIFTAKVLEKYDVGFHQCADCGFIQTDTPTWLDEAYSDAIISGDVGLVRRNLSFSVQLDQILKKSFDYNSKFLDYAAGYGLFVRLMRDRGFDFYWDDKYCENIFAQHFTLSDLPSTTKFEAVTAFEVFEHLVNPMEEIEKLFNLSDTIIFSTDLVPDTKFDNVDQWWYFVPHGGQHIAFYTRKSLQIIAEKFGCAVYTNGSDLHILTKKKLSSNALVQTRTTRDKITDRLINMLSNAKSDAPSQINLGTKVEQDAAYVLNLQLNKK